MAFRYFTASPGSGAGYELHDWFTAVRDSGEARGRGVQLVTEILKQNRDQRAREVMQQIQNDHESQKQRDYLSGLLTHAQFTQAAETARDTARDKAMIEREQLQQSGMMEREMEQSGSAMARARLAEQQADERLASQEKRADARLESQEKRADARVQEQQKTERMKLASGLFSDLFKRGRSGAARTGAVEPDEVLKARQSAYESAVKRFTDRDGNITGTPEQIREEAERAWRFATGEKEPELDPLEEASRMIKGGSTPQQVDAFLRSKGIDPNAPLGGAPAGAPEQPPVPGPVFQQAPQGGGQEVPWGETYPQPAAAPPSQGAAPQQQDPWSSMDPNFSTGGSHLWSGMGGGPEPTMSDLLAIMGKSRTDLDSMSQGVRAKALSDARSKWLAARKRHRTL